MTSKLTRGPLFAEVHNVPDDYHFTAEELDRIIAGDLFTPRQGAIMARELQERRKADSEPVAYIGERMLGDLTEGYRSCGRVWSFIKDELSGESRIPLYRHAQPVVPATLPCSVELKPGLIIGKGCKTETLLTALRRRADYNADIDAMTPEERAEYDASIKAFKAMLPQLAPVVLTFEEWCKRAGQKPQGWVCDAMKEAYEGANYPVIPDGYVIVPMRLTAENGAKGALSGEFSEIQFVNCPECFGDDECETCDGSGRVEIKVPVSWTTIKAIWVKGVEHFATTITEE
ncbi:hypothetical protein [Klebsiella michiganensis]|uniref:hypothetical protein n=1 Tax=Klebsiella michiganensis TaxID=1134687 RepID=UPI0021145227|nr:hypothetical protein [Klebsiella michiganensis]